MTDEEKLHQIEVEYAKKFGDPCLPGLPDFFEQQLPDDIKTTDEVCAYVRERIKNNDPFNDEYCGEI